MNFKKLLTAVLAVGLVVWMAPLADAATVYVKPGGNDANNGLSWNTAKKTIQAGVDAAGYKGLVIVTNGTYVLNTMIIVTNSSTIRSVNGANSTIVDGNGSVTSNRVFGLADGCVLQGLTIRNGYSVITSSPIDHYGGGVYCLSTNALIENCVISANRTEGSGGGVYGGTLKNCTISGNMASTGGGVYNSTLNNCTISSNIASSMGGVYNSTLNNCLVFGNKGYLGCGGGDKSTLNNCTVSGNAGGTFAGVAIGGMGGNSILNNCIVFYNEANDIEDGCTVRYTCALNAPAGNGNITNAPMFINPGSGYGTNHVPGNYRLAIGSPCINAGHNQYAPTNVTPYDLDGHGRILNGTVDMGAYEYSIPIPTNIVASDGGYAGKVRVRWDKVTEASGYQVWRHTSNNPSSAVLVGKPNTNTYDDTTVPAGVIHYYWVAATNISYVTGLSSNDTGWREFIPPQNVRASDGAHTNKIALTWSAESNATGYTVWRNTSNNTNSASKLGSTATTNYNDMACEPEVLYYYWVTASNSLSTSKFSASDSGWRGVGPKITGQTYYLDLKEGETASISVTATGSEPLYYQWQKDGSDILGAIAATYTIASLVKSDEGAYRCIVTNVAGAATSDVATLKVNILPGIGLSTTLLTYAATYGSSPSAQTLVLTNYGEVACNYSSATDYGTQGGGWFDFAPATGSLAGSASQLLTGGVNSAALTVGVYYATTTITAPDATNSPQSFSVVLEISKADQAELTFQPASPQGYNTTNGLSASGGSGTGAWSYSVVSGDGEIVGLTNLWMKTSSGTVRVRATKAGDANYNAASIEADVIARKGTQIIVFPNPGAQIKTNVLGLSATASSGLGVTFKVENGPAQITFGTNLSFTGTGVVRVSANQAGDDNWYPAAFTNIFNVLNSESEIAAAAQHVSPDGDDTQDGLLWITAKKTIQAAVDAVRSNKLVLVTNGTYVSTGQITVSNAITICSVNGPDYTIVDGNGDVTSNRVFYLNEGCVLQGLTICNGQAVGDPGSVATMGGGVYCASTNALIEDCVIHQNRANEGGGVCGGTLNNCTITGNTAGMCGGGAKSCTLNNCMITGNAAQDVGGGVCGEEINCTLNNCTIVGNTATYGGGGVYGRMSRCKLNNCIVFYNEGGDIVDCTNTSYTCASDAPTGNGNITNVPRFINSGSGYGTNHVPGNYRLAAGSPCINAGHNQYAPTNVTPFDLDGHWRIWNDTVDMGAYEYGSGPPAPANLFATDGVHPDVVLIFWRGGHTATGYEVWRHTSANLALAELIATSADDYAIDTTAVPGTVYYYWARAITATGTSVFSNVDSGWCAVVPSAPTGVSASDGLYTNQVLITWDSPFGASSYELWRNTNDDPVGGSLLATVRTTSFSDTSAIPGTMYYYWLKATNVAGASEFSLSDSGWRSIAAAITVQPQSLIRAEGEAASMSITATGSEPLYYQWQKDGSDILGATSSTYAIAAVAKSDAGAYRCIVTNIASTVMSDVAKLTVNTRPGIGLSTTLLTYATIYGSSPPAQTLVLTNYGQAACSYSNVITYGNQGGGWFDFAPVTGLLAGSASQVFTGSVNSTALTAGVYYATNTVIAPAATNSPQSFSVVLEISKADQAELTFQPASPQTYNTTNGLSASGGSGEGAWSYSIVSGEGEIFDFTNLWVKTGVGTVRVRATKAGDANYHAASIEADVIARKAEQIIDCPNPGDQLKTNVLVLSAAASSGLGVTFKVEDGPAQITSGADAAFLSFTGTGTVSVSATQAGDDNWASTSITNTFNVLYADLDVVATPVFNPDGGAHHGSSVNVTITCDTPGATIRYTTNGEEPTELSLGLFSGGTVSVPIPGTLKAKAWKVGMNPSAVKSAIYTVALRPPAAPVNVAASDGTFTNKITVEWRVAARATSYRIFRHTADNAAAAEEIGTSTATTYNDTTAVTGKTYYYWVKAFNAAGASGLSKPDTGYLGVVGPLVTANGMVGDNVRVSHTKPITVTAAMTNLPTAYLGYDVDWWVAAYVQKGGLWFYFDPEFNLLEFDINLFNCRPVYQGPLYNVPPQTLVENLRLAPGVYQVWFAVDYPKDGVVNLTPGYYLMDCMTLTVE
ncbi:MAG: immunoglobulin domain-containing protein [Kiritimatiellia bacterium]